MSDLRRTFMKGKKLLCLVLAMLMVFTYMPAIAFADDVSSSGDIVIADDSNVSPEDVVEVASKVGEALGKFVEKVDGGQMATLITRFGGVTAIASGCITILQMAGIIEDPTAKGIANILSQIGNVQDQLKSMDAKLDDISKKLIEKATTDEERSRQTDANRLLDKWQSFRDHNCDPMVTLVDLYQAKIDEGALAWWNSHETEGVTVLYTTITQDGKTEVVPTYCRDFDGKLPKKSDNGEDVLAQYSFGIPDELMPDTSKTKFNINTYADTLNGWLAEAIYNGAKDHKLIADSAFYDYWGRMNDEQRQAKADEFATEAFHTIMLRISCEAMTNDHEWVSTVISQYNKYCDNIMDKDSGIQALIGMLYFTYGFEGEIKDDLTSICDGMIATAGFYGQFAMNCASQDDLTSFNTRNALMKEWVDTIKKLDDFRTSSLTGHDDYCFFAKSRISFIQPSEYSTVDIKYTRTSDVKRRFDDWSKTDWQLVDDDKNAVTASSIGDVYNLMLYHQYLVQKQKDETYAQYLKKNSVNIPKDFSGIITTSYQSPDTFPLADGLKMKAKKVIGSYFSTGKEYYINKGNDSDVDNDCFVLHERIQHNCLDPDTGAFNVNQVLTARAAYCESHAGWFVDEAHAFYMNCDFDHDYYKDGDTYTDRYYYTKQMNMLTYAGGSGVSFQAGSPLDYYSSVFEVELKENNDLSVSGKTVSLKAAKLKKAKQAVKRSKAMTVSKAHGTISYKLSSVSKTKSKKYFRVDSRTGNITVKKGLKKGTYRLKITVKASGSAKYRSVSQTAVVKIKVK